MNLNVTVIDDVRSVALRSGTEVDSTLRMHFDTVDERRSSLRGRARQRMPNSRPPILAPSVTFRPTLTTSRGDSLVPRGAMVVMSRSFEPNIPVVVDSAYDNQCDCLYCSADHNLTEFEFGENENMLQDVAGTDSN